MNHQPNIFWHNVGLVFSGTAIAQAVPLIGSLIIARIYAPVEFGVFATWLGIISVVAVVLTGRFEAALAVVADGQPRNLAVWATLTITALSACVLSVLVLVSVLVFPDTLHFYSRALVWFFVPTSFFMACINTWQCWAAAEGQLRALTAMRISQAIAITGTQILASWLMPTAVGLAFGHFFGALLAVLVAAWLMPLRRENSEDNTSLWIDMKCFWRTQHRFPMLALPADAINTVAGQLPVLILASRFGAEVAGLLALALRVLGAPIGLLGASVLDVFKRSSAASFREHGHCRHDYWRTFKVLTTGAIVATIVIVFSSEPLFELAFGERWRQAGIFAAWLMPMFALRFIASPLSYVFYVAGKQHIDLIWQVALLLMTLAALYLPPNYTHAILAYSVGYSLLYIVYLALSWRFSKGVII
jgi:O-antigen/teichoic acid export membrane protein